MFFDTRQGLLRVVVGPLAHLFLRISGKRALTKLNAFDLVVTVALGSTLSSIVLTKSLALLDGVLAPALRAGALSHLTIEPPAPSSGPGGGSP